MLSSRYKLSAKKSQNLEIFFAGNKQNMVYDLQRIDNIFYNLGLY